MSFIAIFFVLLNSSISCSCSTLIFSIYESDRNLRELIGSIHHFTSDNVRTVIFGDISLSGLADEISLWRRVRFVDIKQEILYKPTECKSQSFNNVLPFIIEYLFEEELEQKIIYIESGYLFHPKLLKINNGNAEGIGYKSYTKNGGYEKVIKPQLKIMRGLNTGGETKEVKVNLARPLLILPRVSNDSKWTCSIKVRTELVFSSTIENNDNIKINRNLATNGESVAMLVPSKNDGSRAEDCALVKYLLPSLRNDEEMGQFDVTLYVGYDSGDGILSIPKNRDYIKSMLKNITVIFIELPHSGWLTFIWNCLFAKAYADGNEYFVQLNDDVEFKSEGWLSSSIRMLPKSTPGVIGMNDNTWQCKLYTQTLVNRIHYEIFHGQYFPLVLRNWYSDNWISSVYGEEGGKCNKAALISNGHVNTRYSKCDGRYFQEAVLEGKNKIKRYHKIRKISKQNNEE